MKARFECEGKWYCGVHDPKRLQAKRDRYQAARNDEFEAEEIMHKAEGLIEELGRKVPEIAAQYAIVDAARGMLKEARERRLKVR